MITMERVVSLLGKSLYGNPLEQWFWAAAIAAVTFLAARVAKGVLIRKLSRDQAGSGNGTVDLVARLLRRVHLLFLLAGAAFLGSLALELQPTPAAVLGKTVGIIVLIQIGLLGSQAIGFSLDRYRARKIDIDAASVTTFSAVAVIGRILLWSVVLLVALANLGVDVTALVAGLGVGGIAVALAVQNILGDLFASFSIVLDRPFVMGDFIIVGEHLGTVEHIGLKTTRLRSLSGEQLVFSNTDLLGSRIRNYKRMAERRVVFSLGVLYQTSPEQLEKIPQMIRDIVEAQTPVRFDRAHFKEYGASSLNFEIVYYILDPDYNRYMDIQQAVNLEIYRRFDQEGIEFAYPTQTLYLRREVEDAVSA